MTNATTIIANPGELWVDIDRVIDAPVDRVFAAYTEQGLISKWLGPRGYVMDVTAFDPRDGGEWAFTHITPTGGRFGFRGTFHTVKTNERIIQTFEYLGAEGHVSLESLVFEDLGDKTELHGHAVYQSVEDRDAMINNGMERGVVEGFEQLDEVLAS
ncbi:MAG TPA: SRPBCC family protein [Galbitalea sp.]|jgi:uncharacterized protein YndB with AHSA1/START domain|nr:SRPBCC family protein [Galbitalea sp.]